MAREIYQIDNKILTLLFEIMIHNRVGSQQNFCRKSQVANRKKNSKIATRKSQMKIFFRKSEIANRNEKSAANRKSQVANRNFFLKIRIKQKIPQLICKIVKK